MKKLLGTLLIAGVICLGGCGGGESTEAGYPRGITADTIRLGTHTDLSGQLAIWGVPMVNGIRQRFDEVSASGGIHGRTIEYFVEDSQYQVPAAVKATNKLINVNEIFAMIGAMGTPQNNAVFDTMFEANVPNIFPLTAAVSMYEPLHPLKFSYYASYRDQARSGIRYMVEQHGYKKVCLQTMATDYGAEIEIGFEQAVEEHDLEVVYVGRHKGSETDFAGTVTSIKNSGCEFLFLGPFIKDTILIYTTARDAGWEGTIAANMVPYLPEIASAADGRMEGLYAVAPFYVPDFSEELSNDWLVEWHSKYAERFGEEPAVQSVIGYVMADILVMSLEAAGPDLSVEKMVSALESIGKYDDPFGGPSMSFSATKHMGADYMNLYQVKDGKWVTVAESLPY
jgi:branched-chain amino acid transport system substrate-binding protein